MQSKRLGKSSGQAYRTQVLAAAAGPRYTAESRRLSPTARTRLASESEAARWMAPHRCLYQVTDRPRGEGPVLGYRDLYDVSHADGDTYEDIQLVFAEERPSVVARIC